MGHLHQGIERCDTGVAHSSTKLRVIDARLQIGEILELKVDWTVIQMNCLEVLLKELCLTDPDLPVCLRAGDLGMQDGTTLAPLWLAKPVVPVACLCSRMRLVTKLSQWCALRPSRTVRPF